MKRIKAIACVIILLAFPHLVNGEDAPVRKLVAIQGFLGRITKEDYKAIDWVMLQQEAKELDGLEVRLIGYLNGSTTVLDDPAGSVNLYETKDVPNGEKIISVSLPRQYQSKLKKFRKRGTNAPHVEIYGVLFTRASGSIYWGSHCMIRIDAVTEIK